MKPILTQKFKEGLFSIYPDDPKLEVIQVNQTHSSKIIEYIGTTINELEADGIIIDPKKFPNKILAIKTADCLPVLLIGDKIALIHAGWRGIKNEILTQSQLSDLNIKEIFIAPFIKKFEVQDDFKVEFKDNHNFYIENEKLFFSLTGEASDQLKKFFPNAKINISPICTLENLSYNSYRRNKTILRNWNVFHIN